MHTIQVTNVNQALAAGLRYLAAEGVEETSRNGNVIVAPGPVVTVYKRPWERVLFSPTRDANPFFHLMESLWMLAGRNDIKFLAFFAANMANYSDDGVTQHGAYGHRWRYWFGYDQLPLIVKELKDKPESRRCVVAMWDGGEYSYAANGIAYDQHGDLLQALHGGKDVPCNTHAYVDMRNGELNLTVCCRSNDIWWGAYGANAVHFSVLQEYLASELRVRMGEYRQFSNNYHIYTSVVQRRDFHTLAVECEETDFYEGAALASRMFSADEFEEDLGHFFKMVDTIFESGLTPAYEKYREKMTTSFFTKVVVPMFMAYYERKKKLTDGHAWLHQMKGCLDWQLACTNWIKRREEKNNVQR